MWLGNDNKTNTDESMSTQKRVISPCDAIIATHQTYLSLVPGT